jgi:hypothetical protein
LASSPTYHQSGEPNELGLQLTTPFYHVPGFSISIYFNISIHPYSILNSNSPLPAFLFS